MEKRVQEIHCESLKEAQECLSAYYFQWAPDWWADLDLVVLRLPNGQSVEIRAGEEWSDTGEDLKRDELRRKWNQ